MAEFDREFSSEPPEALEWAFKAWRRDSPFFPAISEICKLLAGWHREKREAVEADKRRAEREAIEQARKEGKLLDFVDVVQQVKQVLEATPEPEHMKRLREFRQRLERASLAVGTLHLSEDQIAARREKEREECERYRR